MTDPAPPARHLFGAPRAARLSFGRLLSRLAPSLAHRSAAEIAAIGCAVEALAEEEPPSPGEARRAIAQHLDPDGFRRWLHGDDEQPTEENARDDDGPAR